VSARGLAALERLADAVERLADDYATVHKLRIGVCPTCHMPADSHGLIYHVSGCPSLWPDPAKLHIPGEGL
jgi:hypothetical protein